MADLTVHTQNKGGEYATSAFIEAYITIHEKDI
jgi:hypothetical protein